MWLLPAVQEKKVTGVYVSCVALVALSNPAPAQEVFSGIIKICVIKIQTLKTNGIQVTFVVSFLEQALIYLLQAVNYVKLPTYDCTLPKI